MGLVTGQRANTGLIEVFQGTAYDNIKLIADNMDAVIASPANAQLAASAAASALLSKADIETSLSGLSNASNLTQGTLAKERLPNEISASTSGNAATATKLASAVLINKVAFDASTDITIATGAGCASAYRNLTVAYTSAPTAVKCEASWEMLGLHTVDYSDGIILPGGTNVTTGSVVGVNGHDTAPITSTKWVYYYIIHNSSTSSTAGILSDSATAPALPDGYTYFRRVGVVRIISGYARAMTQRDDMLHFPSPHTLIANGAATDTTTIADVPSVIPEICKSIRLYAYFDSTDIYDTAYIGPDNNTAWHILSNGMDGRAYFELPVLTSIPVVCYKVTARTVDIYAISYQICL